MAIRKGTVTQIILALILVVLGIFIMIRQDLFKQIFVIALGLFLIVTGIKSLATMGRYSFSKFNSRTNLIKGILGLVVGVFAVVMPIATGLTLWKIILFVVAVELVIAAIVLIFDSFIIAKMEFPIAPLVIEAALSLVLAVVLFAFPEGVADLAITILALIIIIAGIVTAIVAYLMRNKVVVTTYEKIEE
jgi:uncharacterized membrane protein HdeD (DUF308 family)